MSEPVSAGAAGVFAAYKMKFLLLGAAALGACVMAMARPPRTRWQLFSQGAVALGSSFLFGGTLASIVDFYAPWVDMATASHAEATEFLVAVHGMVGALAWGVMGGLGALRDQLRSDPRGFIQWAKDLIFKRG